MTTSPIRLPTTLRDLSGVLSVAATLLVASAGVSGSQQKQNALISPSRGTVGAFTLGTPVGRYSGVTRSDCRLPAAPAGEACYSTRDGDFLIGVDRRGTITAVRTTSPEMFTDRYVRPRHTHMREVVSRYGVPERIDRSGSLVFFVYGGLAIEAEGGRTSEEVMPKPVDAITLRRDPARR